MMQIFNSKIHPYSKSRPSVLALDLLLSLLRNSAVNSATTASQTCNSILIAADTAFHPAFKGHIVHQSSIQSPFLFLSSGLLGGGNKQGIREKCGVFSTGFPSSYLGLSHNGKQSSASFSLVSYTDAEDEGSQANLEQNAEEEEDDDDGTVHLDFSQDEDEAMEKSIHQRLDSLMDGGEDTLGYKDAGKEGIFRFSPDESLTDVEKVYRIVMRFHNRMNKLDMALQSCGVNMTPELVEQVLIRCGDAGKPAFNFFVWVRKQPEYKHSSEAYNLMIKIMGKMRQFGTVWALLEEMRKRDVSLITTETFIILMRRFAAARMVQKAIQVLDEMPKFGCEPDVHTFGCLLDALCKHNRVQDAVALFGDMKARFPPNLKTYNVLLYGWCKVGKLEEARVILNEMKELGFDPDVVAYNTLLNGYAKAGKMQQAFEFMKEMESKGCPPNTASYTNLIQALCSAQRIEEALRLFKDMKRNGCFPDVIAYTTLVNGLCKSEKLDQAYKLLDDMIQQGCAPNQMTYFCLLRAHERREELKEALELVKEMSEDGCDPDLSIYNTLIRLSCRLGQPNEALNLWNDMESKGFSPDLDTYTIFIHGLLKQNNFMEACTLFKEMVRKGLLPEPQYGTLKDLLNGLLRAGKLEMAIDIWETMKKKDSNLNVFVHTIWIQALFASGNVKEACRYCMEMIECGLLPQPDTYDKLMRGLRKLYNRRIAGELTERLKQMISERNLKFKSYVKQGQRKEMEKRKPKKRVGTRRPKEKRKRSICKQDD